jgi:hypothetical protein
MSVIFKADGLEAGFTFLIAGSAAATAVRPSAVPASIAKEDFRTLRRLMLGLLKLNIFNSSFRS